MDITVHVEGLTATKLQLAAYEMDMAVEDLVGEILRQWHRPRPVTPVAERVAAHRERKRTAKYGDDWRERYCLSCGGRLRDDALPKAKYCTSRCRQSAYRERQVDSSTTLNH